MIIERQLTERTTERRCGLLRLTKQAGSGGRLLLLRLLLLGILAEQATSESIGVRTGRSCQFEVSQYNIQCLIMILPKAPKGFC